MQIKFLKIKSYSKFTREACFIPSQREEKYDCNTVSMDLPGKLEFHIYDYLELGSTAGPPTPTHLSLAPTHFLLTVWETCDPGRRERKSHPQRPGTAGQRGRVAGISAPFGRGGGGGEGGSLKHEETRLARWLINSSVNPLFIAQLQQQNHSTVM